MDFFQDAVVMTLLALIQVLVVVAGVFFVGFLRKLNKKTQLNLDESVMNQIRSIVDDVVVATNQKIVSVLKENSPNGKLTEEEKEKVFNDVKNAIVLCLNKTQLDHLVEKYNGLDEALSILIEKSVAYNHETVIVTGEIPEEG